ncbi:MAG TPA: hypothetical protein VFA98_16235 [Thermoanaerobaculia bacterium]|nr:hypothetical protein [Thermoanaerobaculia bacterium]
MTSDDVCIHCLKHRSDPSPWVKDNPGAGCTYGFAHEFPATDKPRPQAKKIDKNLCTQCGLHAKNPASASSDCAHEYPS